MRITDAQAQENRRRVVSKASRLIREQGINGMSVTGLMQAVGFTHGGFYNHFASKDALTVEALEYAFRRMDVEREESKTLADLVSDYLSTSARDTPGASCPAPALASEVARQPEAVKQVFADGIDRFIDAVASRLPDPSSRNNRDEAMNLVCQMVGALTLARAMPTTSALGDDLLSAATADCLKGDTTAASD